MTKALFHMIALLSVGFKQRRELALFTTDMRGVRRSMPMLPICRTPSPHAISPYDHQVRIV
jgi:hypothetical protein